MFYLIDNCGNYYELANAKSEKQAIDYARLLCSYDELKSKEISIIKDNDEKFCVDLF